MHLTVNVDVIEKNIGKIRLYRNINTLIVEVNSKYNDR